MIFVCAHSAYSGETLPETAPQVISAAYIDQLIDDNVAEESYSSYYQQTVNSDSTISHEIELRSEWRENSFDDDAQINSGIAYQAFKSTDNFGDFRLNLTAIDESDSRHISSSEDSEDNLSLSRYSIHQTRFPLTESTHMHNIIGTHRPATSEGNTVQRSYSRSFIGRRFHSSESDILGVSSQIIHNNSTLSLSSGDLGRNKGLLLPGFEKDEGKVDRAQMSQAFERHLITGDLWQTDRFEDVQENRPGGRLTLDSILPYHWRSSLTFANSDQSMALLGGLEQEKGDFQQDIGAYFYDPDFVWVNRRLGDDNAGAYYRFTNRSHAYLYGSSLEFRRDGIENELNQKNTILFNANLGYRINKNNRINTFYSYRQLDRLNSASASASFEEHRLRSYININHRHEKQSTLGLSTRYRQLQNVSDSSNDVSLFYTYHQQLATDSGFDVALEYTREQSEIKNQDSYSIDLGWNTLFALSQSLRASVGYNSSNAEGINGIDSQGWHGDIDYNWRITDRLSFDTQVGYNAITNQLTSSNDVSQNLFTDLDIDNLDELSFDNLFVQLGLNYSLGGRHASKTIAKHSGSIGSGSVRGYVFIDSNGDGVFQANEKGLSNIEVFLDSVYPTKTNKTGEFVFRNVGIGKHHLYTDEASLPLPWSLDGKEFRDLHVRLRTVNTLNIGVTNLNSLQ